MHRLHAVPLGLLLLQLFLTTQWASTVAAAPGSRLLLQDPSGAAPAAAPLPAAATEVPEGGSGSSSGSTNIPPMEDPPCCKAVTDLGFSSNLPFVIISVAPGLAEWYRYRGPEVAGTMCVCQVPKGDNYQDLTITLRVRGSSSAKQYQKKSFKMETQPLNGSNGPDNIAFMGFPQESDWVLHGPENDKTLGMRNWLVLNMARRTGRYASRTAYFELFLHTGPGTVTLEDYFGLYIAMEDVKRDKNRVDISRLQPNEDITGGYLIEYENDNINPGDVPFDTRLTKLNLLMAYPRDQSSDFRELRYIQGYVNDMERAMVTPGANISSYLDFPAAIDYFLATEVTKNPDGYRGSIKMSKDKGEPIVMGPVWDYNEAFGLCCGYPIEGYQASGVSNGISGGSAISPNGWRFNICQDPGRCRVEPADGISQWYRALWQSETFRQGGARRWKDLRSFALLDDWFTQEIAAVRKTITEAAARNYQRWAAALADPDFTSWDALFEAEIKQLQQWTLARLAWMDAALAAQAEPGAEPTAYLAVSNSFQAPPPVPGTSASDTQAGMAAAAAAAPPAVAVQG